MVLFKSSGFLRVYLNRIYFQLLHRHHILMLFLNAPCIIFLNLILREYLFRGYVGWLIERGLILYRFQNIILTLISMKGMGNLRIIILIDDLRTHVFQLGIFLVLIFTLLWLRLLLSICYISLIAIVYILFITFLRA